MKVSPYIGLALAVILAIALVITKAFGPVLRSWQDERSLAENGVHDTALVLRVRPTGTIVNEQPMVRLTLERQLPNQRYRAEIAQVVPQVYLPRVQPGMRVPVLADAGDKDRMVIDFDQLDEMPAR